MSTPRAEYLRTCESRADRWVRPYRAPSPLHKAHRYKTIIQTSPDYAKVFVAKRRKLRTDKARDEEPPRLLA